MNMIEPRIVIPLYHHIEGLKNELGTADAFCKELGVCQRQDGNRLKIAKKDLPAEDQLKITQASGGATTLARDLARAGCDVARTWQNCRLGRA